MKASSNVTDLLLWKRFDCPHPVAKRAKPTAAWIKWSSYFILTILVLTLILAWHWQHRTATTELPLQAMQQSTWSTPQTATAATTLPEPLPE